MKAPHITFQYEIERDIENIRIGLDLVRKGRKPEATLASIIQQRGDDPSMEDLEEYLTTHWAGKEESRDKIIGELQESWSAIETTYFSVLAEKMQLKSFSDIETIPAYLSTRRGCGYGYGEKPWFAVSALNGVSGNILTTMHEVMHIFFHRQWWEFCKEQGVPDKNIWDIKEALTILLNFWFKDQLTQVDTGKEEHTNLRKKIERWYTDDQDFVSILKNACDYMKLHGKESPTWIR